jgi:DNA polymerase III epsilon subunit-like protein
MRVVFFDTETTGVSQTDRLLQLAVKGRGEPNAIVNALYTPPVPISIGAMSVHHITDKKLLGRPAFADAPEYSDIRALFHDTATIAVAHNAAFDIGMLARDGIVPVRTICTYKVARALDPDEKIGRYSLQYLRYLLDIDIDAKAHDAIGDVLVLEHLFERLLAKVVQTHGDESAAIEEMVAMSQKPLYFSTFRFGKHDGKKIADVAREDRGYLEWLLRKKREAPEGETEWIQTLEHYLAKV